MNNDFNVENEKKDGDTSTFVKKIIIIAIIAIVLFVILLLLRNNTKNNSNNYIIEFDAPSVIYIDEPIEIPVKLKGSTKDIGEITTSYFANNENIIELLDNEFYGKNGSVYIKPLSIGKDEITFVSTTGVDKYTKTLDKKTMHITVCPKFDENLISTKQITINKGTTTKLNINFGDEECSKIITYTSTNKYVASVSPYGEIKGESTGTAQIIISNGSNSITVTVNVM